MVKYRCNKCGREFPNKTPHKCLTGFQKRHLTYTRVYEDRPLLEVDTNILELLKMIPKEEQRRVFSWRYSEYCPVPNKDNGFLGFIETYKQMRNCPVCEGIYCEEAENVVAEAHNIELID